MDIEQATAMLREFAETEPTFASECDGSTQCMYCGYDDHVRDADGHWRRILQPLQRHEPSCIWRRACEALGIVPPEEAPPAAAPFDPMMAEIWAPLLMRHLRARIPETSVNTDVDK